MNAEDSLRLMHVLQALALPLTGQLYLDVGKECRVQAMSRAFQDIRQALIADSEQEFSRIQLEAMSRLYRAIANLGQHDPLPDCSDLSMRRHQGWRQVRLHARRALVAFGWNLELPPRQVLRQTDRGITSLVV